MVVAIVKAIGIEFMFQTYLPLVIFTFSLIGVQDETLGGYAAKYAAYTTVHIHAKWDEVEAVQGKYDWVNMDEVVIKIPKRNNLIIGTRTSPEWARKYTNRCSQPKQEYYYDYALFVDNLVDRYNPWGIEIWNEPDVKPWQVGLDNWMFGCWDTGEDYGKLVAEVRRVLGSTSVNIIAGALMLSDDTKDFARVALAHWGDYDYVSYHAYASIYENNWNVIDDKAHFIRTVTPKPILVTETSLLSDLCTDYHSYRLSEYLSYVLTQMVDWRIDGFLWYTIGGNKWRCSDLYYVPDAYNQYMGLSDNYLFHP